MDHYEEEDVASAPLFGSHSTSGDLFAAAEYVSSVVGYPERGEQVASAEKLWPEVLGPKEIEKYRSPDSLFASWKRNKKTRGIGSTGGDNAYRIKYKRRDTPEAEPAE